MSKNRAPRQKLGPAQKRYDDAKEAVLRPTPKKFVGPHATEQDAANCAAAEHFGLPYVKCKPGSAVIAEPPPDPHAELEGAVAELLAAMKSVMNSVARSGGKISKRNIDAAKHEAIKAAIRRIDRADLLEKPYNEKAIARVFVGFATFASIEGLPTAHAFVRRLRGRKPDQ